jgi:MoxR-like ATPase
VNAERTTTVAAVAPAAEAILDEVERAVVGKRQALELVLLALLAGGHVLLEDVPGTAKTLAAVSFSQVLGLEFGRVQFTPDLMPADVTGSSIFDPRTSTFEFRPGPVFTNLLLADEINRAPAKTQAAVVVAMEVVLGSAVLMAPVVLDPFDVLATQNPIEYEGTYPLPEAQLDRFLLRTAFGYPDPTEEWQLLERRLERRTDEVQLRRVLEGEGPGGTLVELQRALEDVHVAPALGAYLVAVVDATRASNRVQVGASPRGSLALLKLARAKAATAGRDFVTPDDVKSLAVPALAHRLVLKTELWVRGVRPEEVVADLVAGVPTPPPSEVEPRR